MQFRLDHGRRVDTDNLAKAVMDGLTGIAWEDDSQVCVLVATRERVAGDPGVDVRILDGPESVALSDVIQTSAPKLK